MANKYLQTTTAAEYCTELGKPTSASFLRKLRLKGPNDPGSQGPAWVRDPSTNYVLYAAASLEAWVTEWEQQLSATRVPKRSHLDSEKGGA
jgi:hypothetical protein